MAAWRTRLGEFATRMLLPTGAEGLANSGKTKMYDPSRILCWPDVKYTASEDPRRRVDVFAPGEDVLQFPREPTPVLLVVHGGGFKLGSRKLPSIVKFAERCVESHGMLVMSAGYRMGSDVPLEAQIGDVSEALSWAGQHASAFGGDPERVFAVGHSAGAFLAMHAALGHRRGAVQGILGVSGIYDLENLSRAIGSLSETYVERIIGSGAPASRFALAKSQKLAAFDKRILLLMAQNELPLLKGDAFAIFNSPRRANCTLEEIRDCNHWGIITKPDTATLTAAFVNNELNALQRGRARSSAPGPGAPR